MSGWTRVKVVRAPAGETTEVVTEETDAPVQAPTQHPSTPPARDMPRPAPHVPIPWAPAPGPVPSATVQPKPEPVVCVMCTGTGQVRLFLAGGFTSNGTQTQRCWPGPYPATVTTCSVCGGLGWILAGRRGWDFGRHPGAITPGLRINGLS